jgi:hypothetical protein
VVYANPRLTPEGYARFYGEGHYRRMVQAATGADPSCEHVDKCQRHYAGWLRQTFAAELRAGLARHPEGTRDGGPAHLVDIGGGVGTMAQQLVIPHGAIARVVDPAADEIEYARRQGLAGDVATAEAWVPDRQYEVVCLMQTIDHLPEPATVLGGLRHVCTRLLLVDIIDHPAWFAAHQQSGSGHTALKIDHPTNLHDAALEAMLLRCGFRIVKRAALPGKPAIAYAAEPIDRCYFGARPGPAVVQQIIRGAYCAHTALWNSRGGYDC